MANTQLFHPGKSNLPALVLFTFDQRPDVLPASRTTLWAPQGCLNVNGGWVDYLMSFRRRKSEDRQAWDRFLRQHRQELLLCGIPEDIFQDQGRFLVFLEHGFDEAGGMRFDTAFSTETLRPEQVHRFAQFILKHFQRCEPLAAQLEQQADHGGDA